MKNKLLLIFILSTYLLSSLTVTAAPTKALIKSFITASDNARKPDMQQEDLDHFLSFMTDTVVDYHAAYNRSFNGKDHLRNGIPKKAAAMKSISTTIEDIIIGEYVAVVVVNEVSEYYKDDSLKNFKGRTIMLLEFDENNKITVMRRYLD